VTSSSVTATRAVSNGGPRRGPFPRAVLGPYRLFEKEDLCKTDRTFHRIKP